MSETDNNIIEWPDEMRKKFLDIIIANIDIQKILLEVNPILSDEFRRLIN
jgi:hypothetical protein